MLAWLLAFPPADNAPTTPGGGGESPGFGNPFMLIMLAVLVLFMFLPMLTQKKEKRRTARMKELKKHDRVVTTGGIFGTIVNIDEDLVTLEVAKEVRMKLKRSSIYDLENGPELDKQAAEAKRKPVAAKS
ncbi:MAG: preprotein translocase subunit YajC [Planctomycetota bacterium]|jgi:preprotein translocase subunit YajC